MSPSTGEDPSGWDGATAEAARAGAGQAVPEPAAAPPDFLTADADELIAGQYSDRPQLRPVFDAVLAALPVVGPATVQARRTMVSFVTPRRTFAVIQATTKSRVDLGLRLEHERPGGRLLAARDLGAATVRIPLSQPEDVDAEVLGWMRRAYRENAAPPPARRPAHRPAPKLGELTVVIEGINLPGLTYPSNDGGEYRNFHIGLATKSKERPTLAVPGRPWRAAEPVPGGSPSARWQVPVTVRRDADGFDFTGPYVRGARDDRHLFLAWGDVHDDGTLRLVRGSKLKLTEVDPRLVEEAMRPGHLLVARIPLTGTPEEPALTWSVRVSG
jgi:Family of unknown function (DUF5990)/Domain of unknown function (DUF5655)